MLVTTLKGKTCQLVPTCNNYTSFKMKDKLSYFVTTLLFQSVGRCTSVARVETLPKILPITFLSPQNSCLNDLYVVDIIYFFVYDFIEV